MRPSTLRNHVTALTACLLLLAACETYKGEGNPGTAAPGATPAAADPAAPPTKDTTAAAPTRAAPGTPAPDSATSCDAVVAHLVGLTEKEIASLPEEQRKQAAAVLPTVRTQVAQSCTATNWSEPFKRCILGASTEDGLRECEKFAPTPAETAVTIPPKPADAKPMPTKAAPVDGPACDNVVSHVIEVALAAPDIPEAQREQMKAVLPQQREVMTKACDDTPWPAPLRDCLLKAKNAADIQGCRQHAGP